MHAVLELVRMGLVEGLVDALLEKALALDSLLLHLLETFSLLLLSY